MVAARDRARRAQAALGDGVAVLMGCTLVVLGEAPRAVIESPAPAANSPLTGPAAVPAAISPPASRRAR